MTIPPKYEDVVAKLDAALGHEADLREELATLRESYESMRDRKNSIVELQQRLTVAEQRVSDLEGLLREIISDELFPIRQRLWMRVVVALKPSAEMASYCTHPPGCKQCSWCGFKAESKLAAEGEGS